MNYNTISNDLKRLELRKLTSAISKCLESYKLLQNKNLYFPILYLFSDPKRFYSRSRSLHIISRRIYYIGYIISEISRDSNAQITRNCIALRLASK